MKTESFLVLHTPNAQNSIKLTLTWAPLPLSLHTNQLSPFHSSWSPPTGETQTCGLFIALLQWICSFPEVCFPVPWFCSMRLPVSDSFCTNLNYISATWGTNCYFPPRGQLSVARRALRMKWPRLSAAQVHLWSPDAFQRGWKYTTCSELQIQSQLNLRVSKMDLKWA